MKILHITDHLGLGGAQSLLKEICNSKEEFYCYILRRKENELQIQNRNLFFRNSRSRLDILSLFEIKRLIREQNITILHCHLQKSFISGYIVKIIFFKNIKLIFHEHGNIFKNRFFYNLFLRKAQKKVNLFIAVSKATKQKLIESGRINPKKIEVLYNCLDLDKFNINRINFNLQEERAKIGIREASFVVGFAGRITQRKGWREIIKVTKVISNTYQNFKLLIAGDGPDRNKMINFIKKLQLSDKVIYLGAVSNMNWFYRLLDCYVMPSYWEPMGITAIEAQSCSVPVIATNVEGLNEIVRDNENALLFQLGNEEELAKKINLLYRDNTLRDRLIKNGLKNSKKYSLNSYTKELMSIYERS